MVKKLPATVLSREGWKIWGGSECGNRLSGSNLLIVLRSNYGSVLLSVRDMTTGRTTDAGRTDVGKQRISDPLRSQHYSKILLTEDIFQKLKTFEF